MLSPQPQQKAFVSSFPLGEGHGQTWKIGILFTPLSFPYILLKADKHKVVALADHNNSVGDYSNKESWASRPSLVGSIEVNYSP